MAEENFRFNHDRKKQIWDGKDLIDFEKALCTHCRKEIGSGTLVMTNSGFYCQECLPEEKKA